jgi:deoxyribodipyrimidine photo-lyase
MSRLLKPALTTGPVKLREDQHGEYVRLWCPELKDIPNEFIHSPWKMNHFQQLQYSCRLGVDYPNPIIRPSDQRERQSDNDQRHRSNQSNTRRRFEQQNKHNKHQTRQMKSVKPGSFRISDP